MSVGLWEIYGVEYSWSSVIDNVRQQARQYCDSRVKSRGYLRPEAIIEELSGHHRIAAELQLYGGCRVRECTEISDKNLVGNNTIKLTNTKGGRIREVELPPELYRQVAEIVQVDGAFRFEYRSYLNDLKQAALVTEQPYQQSHGLRWNHAQAAFRQAQEDGLSYDEALKEVSLRLGHSRPKITHHYLR